MKTITEKLADALRASLPFLQQATLYDKGAKQMRDSTAQTLVEYDERPAAKYTTVELEDNQWAVTDGIEFVCTMDYFGAAAEATACRIAEALNNQETKCAPPTNR